MSWQNSTDVGSPPCSPQIPTWSAELTGLPKEIAIFRHIITEGNQKGIFNSESPDLAARFLHFCLKGIELPFINGMINRNNDEKFVHHFTERVILNALGHKATEKIQ